jgi:hypothetical protein
MNSLRTLGLALLAVPLAGLPAYAQMDQQQSLLEALSLVSGHMLVAPMLAPEVTREGDGFHVHIPLPKLTSPPDASIDVMATPLDSGVWDITAVTLPPVGTLVLPGAPNTPPVSVRFTIGQQTAQGRIDPTLTVPSPYAMAISDIALHIESTAPPADLTIGQLTLDSTITGDGAGRMTRRSHSRADDWHFTATAKTGTPFAMSLRSFNAVSDLVGLDRAKAEQLRQVGQAIGAMQQATPPVPGQPPSMSPATREKLLAIIDASSGLLTGLNVEETFQGLHFQGAPGNSGDIGEIRLALVSETADDRIAAHLDLAMNDMTAANVAPQFVQYTPKRFSVRTAISGIDAQALRHFLRESLSEGSTPASRQAEAIALLNTPGAKAGIDTLSIESGPMLIQGSARVRALPDGTAGVDVHLTAHGLDAMLALIQADPKARQILPMLFMAKGLGKPEGDNVVWNIGFAHGVVTINGVPMGGQTPGARPPLNR